MSNLLNDELHICNSFLYRFRNGLDYYCVPICVLTDSVEHLLIDNDICFGYETMIKIGFYDNFDFLDIQFRCLSKLQAFHDHKCIYKKILKGFYDNEIIDFINKREGICNEK